MSWLVLLPLVLLTIFALATARTVRRIEVAVADLEQVAGSLPTLGEEARRLRDGTRRTRHAFDRHPNP